MSKLWNGVREERSGNHSVTITMAKECGECNYAFTKLERTIDALNMKIVEVEYNYCPECGNELENV